MANPESGIATERGRDGAHGEAEDQDLSANGASDQRQARKAIGHEANCRVPPLPSICKETHFDAIRYDMLAEHGFTAGSRLPPDDIAGLKLLR